MCHAVEQQNDEYVWGTPTCSLYSSSISSATTVANKALRKTTNQKADFHLSHAHELHSISHICKGNTSCFKTTVKYKPKVFSQMLKLTVKTKDIFGQL